MTTYNVHFGHRDDCVVWAPSSDRWDVSVLRRWRDGRWHCALCRATDCVHVEAAEEAVGAMEGGRGGSNGRGPGDGTHRTANRRSGGAGPPARWGEADAVDPAERSL